MPNIAMSFKLLNRKISAAHFGLSLGVCFFAGVSGILIDSTAELLEISDESSNELIESRRRRVEILANLR
jgi:hypothetical protein